MTRGPTPAENLTIIIAGLSFVLSLMMVMFGLIVRITRKWTRVEDKLDQVAGDLKDIVQDKDKVHQEIVSQMREDRRATNERITWLERNLWARIAQQ